MKLGGYDGYEMHGPYADLRQGGRIRNKQAAVTLSAHAPSSCAEIVEVVFLHEVKTLIF